MNVRGEGGISNIEQRVVKEEETKEGQIPRLFRRPALTAKRLHSSSLSYREAVIFHSPALTRLPVCLPSQPGG
jgi:hypothetical protein